MNLLVFLPINEEYPLKPARDLAISTHFWVIRLGFLAIFLAAIGLSEYIGCRPTENFRGRWVLQQAQYRELTVAALLLGIAQGVILNLAFGLCRAEARF